MSDSSALQSALTVLLQYNFVTVAIISAVGYDYVLTFSNEVEYIWSKPWSWVSTLFIFVRYIGLLNFLISALQGSTFVPGPAKVDLPSTLLTDERIECVCRREIFAIINEWSFVFFLVAADISMILRVWAMYNRSRLLLRALLTLFSLEVITTVLDVAVDTNPKKLIASTVQTLDYSFCVLQATEPKWTDAAVSLQITHGATLCLLAVVQFVRQSLQLYHATKQWQLNRYLSLLVKQGILSFFAIFLFNLVNVITTSQAGFTGWQGILLVILEYVPIYTLTPRFILSIRELYAHDVRGRREGINTGFGLSLSTETIEFAAARRSRRNDGLDDVEEIPMESATMTQAV